MSLSVKRFFLGLMGGLFLLDIFSAVNAQELSMNVCRAFISSRCMNNHSIFSCYGSFALARSAVLFGAIKRIEEADKTRIIYGEAILPDLENFKKALLKYLPEIDEELKFCIYYSETVSDIIQSLYRMRLAYLECYNDYEINLRKRSSAF